MSNLRGHIQCAHNTHLLGELGHAPAMKIIYSEITSEFIFGHKINLSVLQAELVYFTWALA